MCSALNLLSDRGADFAMNWAFDRVVAMEFLGESFLLLFPIEEKMVVACLEEEWTQSSSRRAQMLETSLLHRFSLTLSTAIESMVYVEVWVVAPATCFFASDASRWIVKLAVLIN